MPKKLKNVIYVTILLLEGWKKLRYNYLVTK